MGIMAVVRGVRIHGIIVGDPNIMELKAVEVHHPKTQWMIMIMMGMKMTMMTVICLPQMQWILPLVTNC